MMKVTGLALVPPPSAADLPKVTPELLASVLARYSRSTEGISAILAKVDVNGDGAAPLYRWLKSSAPGLLGTQAIKWNFTKFLVDKNGKVLKRYAPSTTPKEIEQDIKNLL